MDDVWLVESLSFGDSLGVYDWYGADWSYPPDGRVDALAIEAPVSAP